MEPMDVEKAGAADTKESTEIVLPGTYFEFFSNTVNC